MEVVAIQKILAPNLLIYIYLQCVRSLLWCATTLVTLVTSVCIQRTFTVAISEVLLCIRFKNKLLDWLTLWLESVQDLKVNVDKQVFVFVFIYFHTFLHKPLSYLWLVRHWEPLLIWERRKFFSFSFLFFWFENSFFY